MAPSSVVGLIDQPHAAVFCDVTIEGCGVVASGGGGIAFDQTVGEVGFALLEQPQRFPYGSCVGDDQFFGAQQEDLWPDP